MSTFNEAAYSINCGAFQPKARTEKLSNPSLRLSLVAGEDGGAKSDRAEECPVPNSIAPLEAARALRKLRRGATSWSDTF